jgi:uncharacterized peroxidase-related enzyme
MNKPIDPPEYAAVAAAPERLAHLAPRNLAGVSEAHATGEVAGLYRHFRAHFGRPNVPGILQCFATHPPLLRHMMDMAEDLIFSDGHLGRRTKELIATLISARNECPYCADSHGFFLRTHGGSADELQCVLAGGTDASSIHEKDRALLAFACKVNEQSSAIHPVDIETLHNAGWSDLQIAETIHVTALFATYNRVANAFGLESQGLISLLKPADVSSGDGSLEALITATP